MLVEPLMMVNGLMINQPTKDKLSIATRINTKEHSKTERNMGKAFIITAPEGNTKVSGVLIKSMATESLTMPMEISMRVNGKTDKEMGKAATNIQMGTFMMVNGSQI